MGDVGTIRVEVLQVVFSESKDPTYVVPGLANDPLHKRSKIAGARGVWCASFSILAALHLKTGSCTVLGNKKYSERRR